MGWSPLDIDNPRAKEYIGDQPFDEIAECFEKVCKLYRRAWKRKPSMSELIGTVEAVVQTHIGELTSDGETSELVELRYKIRKIPKRQTYQVGDVLQATMKNGELIFAGIFWMDSDLPMVGVYDSRGMSARDINAIINRPLAVKVCPIHPENLEDRSWLVIANARIKATDKRLPTGPMAITGNNNHLEMAEYYYGLRKPRYYDRDEWIVQR